MKKIELIFLIIFSFLLVSPILFTVSSTFPRLDTDYDSSLPVYAYMAQFFWKFHTIPLTVPVTAKGIPVLGDPLNSFLNPLLAVPILFFGINTGLRVFILLAVFASGVAMFFLLKSFKLSQRVKLFGSLLYMSSGTLVAQIASGHIEKVLVFPLVPFLLLFTLRSSFGLKEMSAVSFLIAGTVYSGDLYATWFFILIFIITRVYYLVVNRKKDAKQIVFILLVFPLTVILSSIKLVPFVQDVLPIMQRYFPIDPYQGSVHFFLLPLFFIVPFQVGFYDRPFFQHHLGFSFNWYEYYAFLSPFPLLFLWKIKALWKSEVVRILLILIFTASLYLALGFFYSPFYWLFHLLPLPFRVPQRIVLPLTSIVVLLCCICCDILLKEKNKSKIVSIIFLVSLIWTTTIFWQTVYITFPIKPTSQPEIIKLISKINSKKEAVVVFVPQTQFLLTQENIPIANYYYGWIPKGTETYVQRNSYDFVKLLNEKPKFVLTNMYTSLIPYGYTNVAKNDTIAVWKKD